MSRKILTPKQVSEILECHYHTVLEWCKKGSLFEVEKVKKGLSYTYQIDYNTLMEFLIKKGYIEASPMEQDKPKSKLFLILIEGITSDSYMMENAKTTDNKENAVPFISVSHADNFMKNNVKRKMKYKVIEK